jgi:beta-glucosidase
MVSLETIVEYVQGCDILAPGQDGFGAAVAAASAADVAVVVLGLSQKIEGEEGQWEGNPQGETSRGDRQDLGLPGEQLGLLQAVYETGSPVVLVLMNGSPLAVNWAQDNIPAILEAWYPGQAGGRAVAEAIFGAYNPGGRLPVTFYQSVAQLPSFQAYAMAGRTYRYFEGEPLYPFGYGLSYTTFAYAGLSINPIWLQTPEEVQVSCEVRNTGAVTGDEVVQVYLRDEIASMPVPRHTLVDFKRLRLASGASEWVTFTLTPKAFAFADDDGRLMIEPGKFTIFVGGGQPGTAGVLSAQVELAGERVFLD